MKSEEKSMWSRRILSFLVVTVILVAIFALADNFLMDNSLESQNLGYSILGMPPIQNLIMFIGSLALISLTGFGFLFALLKPNEENN